MATDLLIAYVFSLVFFGLPGLVVAGIGWWFSKRVKNRWGRARLRGALLSMGSRPNSLRPCRIPEEAWRLPRSDMGRRTERL
jgi:hypothetical protein